MKFQKNSKSIFSIFYGKQTNYNFLFSFSKKWNKFLKFWGYKHQKRIKIRFFSSILIFTIFGQKKPKNQNLKKKKSVFSTKNFFWINAQEPICVQLYSYTAQNIRSEVLSEVLKKNLFEIKNKNFRPKKSPPPPQNCNNLGGGGEISTCHSDAFWPLLD